MGVKRVKGIYLIFRIKELPSFVYFYNMKI
jgi:hypothetical protein